MYKTISSILLVLALLTTAVSAQSFSSSVSQGTDDAHHRLDGWPNYRDDETRILVGRTGQFLPDLDIGSGVIYSGYRFNVNIPQGAVIEDAYVEFTQRGWGYQFVTTLSFEDNPSPVTFSSDSSPAHRWSDRTTFEMNWAWAKGSPDSIVRTPSLAEGIQELVTEHGALSSIVLIESGLPADGAVNHEWWSYEGDPTKAARLVVVYSVSASASGTVDLSGPESLDKNELGVYTITITNTGAQRATFSLQRAGFCQTGTGGGGSGGGSPLNYTVEASQSQVIEVPVQSSADSCTYYASLYHNGLLLDSDELTITFTDTSPAGPSDLYDVIRPGQTFRVFDGTQFEYLGADIPKYTNDYMHFRNLDTGEIVDVRYSGAGNMYVFGVLNVGGAALRVHPAERTEIGDFAIVVDTEGAASGHPAFNCCGSATLSEGDYVALYGRASSTVAYLRYEGADRLGTDSPRMAFKNVVTGETIELAVNFNSDPIATIKVAGYTFPVRSASSTSLGDFDVSVVQPADLPLTQLGPNGALTLSPNQLVNLNVSVLDPNGNVYVKNNDFLYQDFSGGIKRVELFTRGSTLLPVNINETVRIPNTEVTVKLNSLTSSGVASLTFSKSACAILEKQIASSYGQTCSSPVFNFIADLNHDGAVSGADSSLLASLPLATKELECVVLYLLPENACTPIDETNVIAEDDVFTLRSQSGTTIYNTQVQYRASTKVDDATPELTFRLVESGETFERPMIPSNSQGVISTIQVGGSTFEVYSAGPRKKENFPLLIDSNGDGCWAGYC